MHPITSNRLPRTACRTGQGNFFRGERYPTHGKKWTAAPAENHKCVGVKEGTLGNMGSEGVREIMRGHFGKYGSEGVWKIMGQVQITPQLTVFHRGHIIQPHITGRASILHLTHRAYPVSEISSRHQPTGSQAYHETVYHWH